MNLIKRLFGKKKLLVGVGVPLILLTTCASKIFETNGALNPYRPGPYIHREKIEVPAVRDKTLPLIDNDFIFSVIEVESEGDPYAESDACARGSMQLLESTWNEFGEGNFSNAFDHEKNERAGKRYLNHLKNYCKENHPYWDNLSNRDKKLLICAAYNGGPTRLKDVGWDIAKMPPETRKHIKKLEIVMN